jgi:hypothetical protein
MGRPKKDIRITVQKQFPEFPEVVDGLSIDELEKKISTYAKESETIEDAKEADEGLQEAKDQVAELSGPYKDAKKAVRLKIKYLIQLLKDKGGNA